MVSTLRRKDELKCDLKTTFDIHCVLFKPARARPPVVDFALVPMLVDNIKCMKFYKSIGFNLIFSL